MNEAEFLAMSGATVTGVTIGPGFHLVRLTVGDVHVFQGENLAECIAAAVEQSAVERWAR